MSKVLLGFTVPEGEAFEIPLHHTIVSGITDLSGKSTTVETILSRRTPEIKQGAVQGKSLVFLTKRGEKTFNTANKIPPFYRERFDWEYVRGLLEASMHERLKFETPWIIRICKLAKRELAKKRHVSPGEGLRVVRKMLSSMLTSGKRIRELDRNMWTLLAAYLDKVLPVIEAASKKFTDTLTIKPGINVMDLTEWYIHEEVQMLVIRSCMEHILEKENNVVVALPEAWKMLPQSRNTPVKLYFEKFIREGATNKNYLIIDAQDLGGVDKTPLRQVSVWIMGKMMEANEVKRLIKQTLGLKIKTEKIQTLELGHFMVASGKKVQEIYVWPSGVPRAMAIEVAKGIRTPESVRDNFLKKKKREVKDEVYKQKFDDSQKTIRALRKEKEEMLEANKELKKFLDNAEAKMKALEQEIQPLLDLRDALGRIIFPIQAETIKKIDQILQEPSAVSVSVEQPTLTIQKTQEPLMLSQEQLLGRLAILYAEGLLPETAFTKNKLNTIMETRFARKEDYDNLEEVLQQMVAWGYLRKVKAGNRWDYKVEISPTKAREQGLIKEA